MRATRVLQAAYVALAAADTALAASARTGARRWRRVTKPLLMPVLATSLATDPRAAGSPLRTSTLAGQALSWGGDVALLAGGSRAFLAGVGSFGLAHVATTAGLAGQTDPGRALGSRTSTRALGVVALVGAPLLGGAAARSGPALGVAVAGYAGLLATMAAYAQHLGPHLPADARRLTAAGAVLFVVSDAVLATDRFVLEARDPRLGGVVMATYAAAQLLLAEGSARA